MHQIHLDGRGIGGQRLDGRTDLPLGHGGPVLHPVGGFLPPAADGGHHRPVIVHDENSGLWILFIGGDGLGEVALVRKDGLHLGLLFGDFGGIDFQTAVKHHGFGVLIGAAVGVHQVGDHVFDQQIGVVILHRLILYAAVEVDLLRRGLLVLFRRDIALLVHFVQHGLLTAAGRFPGGGRGCKDWDPW